MNITIQQIEIFLTVAASNSISHASQQLYISQPALSSKIKQLEDILGYQLFGRTNKGVVLTEEGLRLYAALNPIYHRFRVSVNQILRKNAPADPNSLNIGCLHMTEVINAMVLAGSIYTEKYPSVRLTYEYYNYIELHAKLVCRELDAVFTLSYEAEAYPDIVSSRVIPINSRFLLPSSWGITELNADACALLSGKPLLLEVSKGYEIFSRQCQAHGFTPGAPVYVSSFLELLNMVRSGEGFTIVGDYLPVVAEQSMGFTMLDFLSGSGAPVIYISLARRPDETRQSVLKLADLVSRPELIRWKTNKNYNPAGPGWWY